MKFLIVLIFLLIAPVQTFPQSSGAAVFERAIPVLRQKTRVPLRLPTYLATEDETYPLNAIIKIATPTRYELQLAFTPDCAGGTACRYGMVSGQAIGRSARRIPGQPVKLAQGITGYFIEAQCGANCTDATLSWQQGSYRYTVGIKAANMETLRKVANSAIEKPARHLRQS